MRGKPPDSSLHAASLVLAGLATLALELARHAHAPHPWTAWMATAATLAALFATGWWLRRRSAAASSKVGAVVVVALAGGAPFVVESLARRWFGLGESPEIVQIVSLRNVMLALLAVPLHPSARRIACVLSLFVALTALAFTFRWPGYIAITLYGVVGIWWLMGAYWESLHEHFAAESRRSIPLGIGIGSTGAVLAIVAVAALSLGGASSAVALGGWFWGSGGTGPSDPFAARGVGDGDQLVAAKDQAASFGAVESELFLDSEMPSLYDMFNDTYGEPVTKQKTERAIGLSGPPEAPQQQQTATSRQSGRDFSTVRRQSPRRPDKLADRDSDALLFVAGRVPLHLRLETYDHFDGRIWSHSTAQTRTNSSAVLTMNNLASRPWLTVSRPAESAALCKPETHVVKVMRLRTNRIPTPAHAIGVHIDKVDQRDFYAWTPDDVLQLPVREAIPPLQVIHVQSRSLDTEKLAGHDVRRGTLAAYTRLPDSPQADRLVGLAREWTSGIPHGYPQVEAIVARLHCGEFSHDRTSTVPEDAQDAAALFLLQSRRGPDYLFATSATVLLRSLGYQSRVATGFYVHPDRYQRLARQTPVLEDDVHFWAEVCLDGHTWITLEPTPGYEVLPPRRTWSETLALAAGGLGNHLHSHPLPWSAAALLLFGCAAYRRELADAVCTLIWLVRQRGNERERILATVWLLEQRARLAGRPRARHVTLVQWYPQLCRGLPEGAPSAARMLAAAATRSLYAPRQGTPERSLANPPLAAACRTIACVLTARALRRAARPASPTKTILSFLTPARS